MLVLGDRHEIFAAAASAMIARIPIAHLHGGETTEGAFDEAIPNVPRRLHHSARGAISLVARIERVERRLELQDS